MLAEYKSIEISDVQQNGNLMLARWQNATLTIENKKVNKTQKCYTGNERFFAYKKILTAYENVNGILKCYLDARMIAGTQNDSHVLK